jgi:hypothetical protein
MGLSNLRPLLLLLAGAAFGALITFGVLSQKPSVQANNSVSEVPPKTLKAPSPAKDESGEDSGNIQALANNEETSDPGDPANLPAQAQLQVLQKQHVPIRPVPTPKMVLQANGLPVGVTPDAGIPNPEVYKRLPGLQPPLINRDGRDMGQEAIQMLETHQEETLFPGGIPSASATPMPFPQSVEEANRQMQGYASPSATP